MNRTNPFNEEINPSGSSNQTERDALGLSKIEQLSFKIDELKKEILHKDEGSSEKAQLVNELIQLRLEIQEIKEGDVEINERKTCIKGHQFVEKDINGHTRYCEMCLGIIWRLVQAWYKCKDCGYRCHAKCLHLVGRECAAKIAKTTTNYIQDICPEKGLGEQYYHCAECRSKISFDSEDAVFEPRLCDYTGLFFCRKCHWNDLLVIPARVIHNWDFSPYPVSRSSKQLLEILKKRPLIYLEKENPQLFSFVQDIRIVKKLRADILIMKCYFMVCKEARKQRILMNLKRHQHFVENHDIYSLFDLIELKEGRLEAELRSIMLIFTQHIKTDCVTCLGNGFVCELCEDKNVIFPFDDNTKTCQLCFAVFHRPCFQSGPDCPRCARRLRREAQKLHSDCDIDSFELAADSSSTNPFENDDFHDVHITPQKSTNPFDE